MPIINGEIYLTLTSIRRLSIVKMIILPKLFYRSSATTVKAHVAFLVEIVNPILKFI